MTFPNYGGDRLVETRNKSNVLFVVILLGSIAQPQGL